MKKYKSHKEELELFRRILDVEAFDRIKEAIREVIKQPTGATEKVQAFRNIPGMYDADFSWDDDFVDQDFEPDYVTKAEDGCDFLLIFCFAHIDTDEVDFAEVCFWVVYNDIEDRGWIETASFAIARNPEDDAERLCLFDPDTHKVTGWFADMEEDCD